MFFLLFAISIWLFMYVFSRGFYPRLSFFFSRAIRLPALLSLAAPSTSPWQRVSVAFLPFFARGVGGLPLRWRCLASLLLSLSLSSAAPIRPRVRHIVYCPEWYSGISAVPPRPLGLNADVTLQRVLGCLPSVIILFGFLVGIVFYNKRRHPCHRSSSSISPASYAVSFLSFQGNSIARLLFYIMHKTHGLTP